MRDSRPMGSRRKNDREMNDHHRSDHRLNVSLNAIRVLSATLPLPDYGRLARRSGGMSERTALTGRCLHNQFHSVCSLGSDAQSERNCSGRISEIFEMKLESWILPGAFELKPDPLRGVHLLFRLQGFH